MSKVLAGSWKHQEVGASHTLKDVLSFQWTAERDGNIIAELFNMAAASRFIVTILKRTDNLELKGLADVWAVSIFVDGETLWFVG